MVLQQDNTNQTGTFNPQYDQMLNSEYTQMWQTIIGVIILISIISSLFVIACYLYFKSIRCFSLKLIVMLCISDLLFAVGHLLVFPFSNQKTSSWQCQAQGFIDTFSGLSSVLWTSIISFSLYQIIYKGKNNIEKYFPIFFLVGFLVPCIFSILIKVFYGFGLNENQCWIYQSRTNKYENLVLDGFDFYFELWICFIINSFLIFKVLKFVKENSPMHYNQVRKLILFPIILPLCWLPGTFHLIFDFFGMSQHSWIIILTLIFGYLQGILNAMLFTSIEAVSYRLKSKFNQICLSTSRNKEGDKQNENLLIEQNIDQLDNNNQDDNRDYLSQKSTFLGESFIVQNNGNNARQSKKQQLTKSDIAFISE